MKQLTLKSNSAGKMMDEKITLTKPILPDLVKYTEYLKRIWQTRWLTNDGEFVLLLEEKLKEYLKSENFALLSNGTQALHIALKALNIKGEVITTPFTFSATTNVIIWEGLTPVFADIDAETFNIDPSDVEKKITKKTSAILAVHTYGNPCCVKELQEIADRHNIKLVYDAAHAFGIEYNNQSILRYGDVSTLSFHATKVFNTIEGGAISAKDENVLKKVKLLRNHGIKSEDEVLLAGTNAKMNEFQAVMGLCNLEDIDEKIEMRRKIYEKYKETLSGIDNVKFQRIIASKYNYSYMPICFEDMKMRNQVYLELYKSGIASRKYFYPLTVNSAYFKESPNLIEKYSLKTASDISNRILCLPIYPDLTTPSVERIISIIVNLLRND
jgi:dTDP-4-amino-4,6-dideoxygalactose transaminase